MSGQATLASALAALPAVPPSALLGSWRVATTTFPMWHKGDKRGPSLNYLPASDPEQLLDVVRYRDRRDREHTIRGVDRRNPGQGAHYTWRGAGWLWPFVSQWYVVHLDAAAGVMGIFFTRTLFTPAGMDIAVRGEPSAQPDPAALAAARNALAALPEIGHLTEQLKEPA